MGESELRKVPRAQRGSEECCKAFRDNISEIKIKTAATELDHVPGRIVIAGKN